MVREKPVQTGFGVGTVQGNAFSSNDQKPQSMASSHQQPPLSQSMDFSDPVSIISRAAKFLTAGDHGAMLKLLEILDKHLMLP